MPGAPDVLASSRDPKLLTRTAKELAASAVPADHAALLRQLDSREFLLRLNSEEEYVKERPKRLYVAGVLRTLMRSTHDAAKSTLVALIRANHFRAFESLEELLVLALVPVRPSPPEAIAFWDQHSQPDSGNLHLVIDALLANGSEPALALFERKIADPEQDEEYRMVWLRDPMLRRRNDPIVVACCERMIVGCSVPEEMRVLALEALCDWDPDWYYACEKPVPPLRIQAPEISRETLRRICEFGREHLPLSESQRAAVETTLRELSGESAGDFEPGPV